MPNVLIFSFPDKASQLHRRDGTWVGEATTVEELRRLAEEMSDFIGFKAQGF